MKTVQHLKTLYVVEGAVCDSPPGSIFLDTLSSDKLVELRNLLTSGLGLGRSIKMFQSNAKGIRLVTDLLIKWDTAFNDELPDEMQLTLEPAEAKGEPVLADPYPEPASKKKPSAEHMISAEDLMAHDFEEEDLEIVNREWPNGIPATEVSVKRAFDLGMDGEIFRKVIAEATVKVRDGSKQAALIDLIKRPEGASIKEIAAALKWLNHTVRGAISRDLKKRLGLPVTKSRIEGRGQVYRITS